MDIGGSIYVFEKGVSQPVPADVKRILWEGGQLDVTAPDIKEGLLPEQIENLPARLRRHQYCPTCFQKLNSGVTMDQEILAGTLDPAEVTETFH